jgi:hypothetical protein
MTKNNLKTIAILFTALLIQSCATNDNTRDQPYQPYTDNGSIPIGKYVVGAILLSTDRDPVVVGRNGEEASQCDLISDNELEKITYGKDIDESRLQDLNKNRIAKKQLPVCTGLVKTTVTKADSFSITKSRRSPACWHIQYSFGQPVWWLPPNCM